MILKEMMSISYDLLICMLSIIFRGTIFAVHGHQEPSVCGCNYSSMPCHDVDGGLGDTKRRSW